jgi:hypothetical protein
MERDVNPRSRERDLVVQQASAEVLIYDLSSNKAFCLNETSSIVWGACNGERSVKEITKHLTAKSGHDATEDLVWLALEQLQKQGLVENLPKAGSPIDGLSRREAVKRIGIGTAIALPIVSALVAPRAADAQSVCGTCKCTSSGAIGSPCTAQAGPQCTGACTCHHASTSNTNGSCS